MTKNETRPKVLLALCYILIFALVAFDQWTKVTVQKKIPLYESKTIIKNFLSFTYVQNTGSAFSLGADKEWAIYVLGAFSLICALLMVVFVAYTILKKQLVAFSIVVSCLCAGTIGNMIDRIRLQYVVDFLHFSFGSKSFPIFNVADICVTVSCVFIGILIIKDDKVTEAIFTKKRKDQKTNDKSLES